MNTQQTAMTINQFILDNVDGSGYDMDLQSDPQKIRFLYDCFMIEGRKSHNDRLQAMASWLSGLPSSLDVPFTFFDISEQLTDWGLLDSEPTDDEYIDACNAWWPLLARHILMLIDGVVPARA